MGPLLGSVGTGGGRSQPGARSFHAFACGANAAWYAHTDMVQTKDGRVPANGLASPTRWWAACVVALALAATSLPAQIANAPVGQAPVNHAEMPATPQTPQTPQAPAKQSRAAVPIKRSPVTTQPAQTRMPGGEGPATWRIVAALTVVLGTIFLLRWLGRRVMAGPVSGRATRAVQVVSRTIVSPKQQLMLVQVGRRLVLVGNSGSAMSPLCEISDGEEVSELLGQVQSERSDSISRAFGSLFRREQEKYDAPEAPKADDTFPAEHDRDIDPAEPMGTSREELSELLSKVRGMTSQFRR